MSDEAIQDAVFAQFSFLYPHEAYAQDQERFWTHFQRRCPGVSREKMIEALGVTK